MKTCKHGLLEGTCAMCSGLVVPVGKLHMEWLALCQDALETDTKENKLLSDEVWFKRNRKALLKRFEKTWKREPPYPVYPEQR